MGGRIKMEWSGRIKFLITLQCQWKKKREEPGSPVPVSLPLPSLSSLAFRRRDYRDSFFLSLPLFRFIRKKKNSEFVGFGIPSHDDATVFIICSLDLLYVSTRG